MSRIVTVGCPRCSAEVEMSVYRESYGADADGNRGESRDVADIYEQSCECQWADEEFEKLCDAAVNKNYSDEENFYFEPEEFLGVPV